MQLLTESFIFYEASRYDIRGKARLKTGAKYYVVDTGLRNTALGQISNFGSQLENIIVSIRPTPIAFSKHEAGAHQYPYLYG